MSVAVAPAYLNVDLRIGNKALLAFDISYMAENLCLVIDGQALSVAMGKPSGVATYGDLGYIFLRLMLKTGTYLF